MRTARCNVCGREWPLTDDDGLKLPRKLRLEGACDFQRPDGRVETNRADADLCSWECVIVFARMKEREISDYHIEQARSEGWMDARRGAAGNRSIQETQHPFGSETHEGVPI